MEKLHQQLNLKAVAVGVSGGGGVSGSGGVVVVLSGNHYMICFPHDCDMNHSLVMEEERMYTRHADTHRHPPP